MECFEHKGVPGIGVCVLCGRAICSECIGTRVPRLVCRGCLERRPVIGFEYKSKASFGSWPLVHICMGIDQVTGRPRIAKGIIAIGNIAFGAVALGGVAAGIISIGGLAIGALLALGGAAVGLGLSLGGLAVGSVAIGGLAIGHHIAIGGSTFGGSVIDATKCDASAADAIRQWLGSKVLPPHCPR